MDDNNNLELLSAIAHQFRTPLHVIKGSLYLINDNDSLSEEIQKNIEVINASTEYLSEVIKDLEQAYTQQTSKTFNNEDFNIANMLKKLCFQYSNNDKKNAVILQINQLKSENIYGNRHLLNRVLNNILINSMSYTQNGAITIEVEDKINKDGGLDIFFSVIDSAKGVNVKEREALYTENQFLESDSYKKLNLNLTVIKQNIDKCKGIVLDIPSLKKDAFRFKISVDHPISNNKNPQLAEDHKNDYKILLAEDNLTISLFTKKILNTNGFKCDIACNGLEAIQKFKESEYSLVLMDILMPKLNGIEAAKQIREINSNTPIIAVTANLEYMTQSEFIFDDFIAKPFDQQVFIEKIREKSKSTPHH